MKILKLKLIAFGPFTDMIIDFEKGNGDFHLVYGPNEAGKSSALRGLRQALFGIPLRSPDNFLHPNQRMRIGAVLQHSDGSVIDFIRRKGRGNTLRAGNDRDLLDEKALAGFLDGVSAEAFRTMFGIGHEDLVRGGREIIQGSGNVGQALFAAGSGIANLRIIQDELQREAEALFSPAASRKKINQTLAELEENRTLLRKAELPCFKWEKHDRVLREATDRRKKLDGELARKFAEKNRLERIKEALPLIARRRELLGDLEEHADTVLLPEDFGERRVNLLSALGNLQNQKEEAFRALEETEKKIAKLEVPQPVIDNDEAIEELYQRLGSYKKAEKDRIQLVARSSVLLNEAKEILSRLGDDLTLEEADKLKLKTAEEALIEKLGTEYERLESRREGVEEEILRLDSSLNSIAEKIDSLETPKPVEALEREVERASEYVSLEKHCKSEFLEIENLQKTLESKLARLGLWKGGLRALDSLGLPPLETIDRFEKLMAEAEAEVKRLSDTASETDEELIKIRGSIESLRLEQEVPTEEDLVNARKLRDEGWDLVKKMWQEGEEDGELIARFVKAIRPGVSLDEAYEISVQRADDIADRLRREADRVATKAKLLGDERVKKALFERIEKELRKADDKMKQLEREWVELWKASGIMPLSPREMRAWTRDILGLAEEFSRLSERKRLAEAKWEDIENQRKALSECLRTIGGSSQPDKEESLSKLVTQAIRIIKAQEKLISKREKLLDEQKSRQKDLREARDKARRIEADFNSWKQKWRKALSPLGLSADTDPVEAKAFLAELKELFNRLKEAETLQKRIKGIERDADQFARDLLDLSQRIAPELVEKEPEQIAMELNSRLRRARVAKATFEELKKQKEKLAKKLRDAEKKLGDIMAALNNMCNEARCKSYDELIIAEKRSKARRELERDLREVENQLRKLGAGLTVDEFVADAVLVDPDTIDGRVRQLKDEIEGLEVERTELDQTIGSEKTVLGTMTGGATAAELAEQRQQILARLESDVEKYVRLKIASAVLGRAIERYRAKHQGPILERTNELFSKLTLGSFEGIRAEYDEKGEPVLMGVRPGGRHLVGVEGMSDGTTDQLYLALRLASIEMYLENNEPMPFVVDDILIRFDNERAMAALEVLKDFSAKTQVIFFTHHSHLVELAEKSLSSAISKHYLGT